MKRVRAPWVVALTNLSTPADPKFEALLEYLRRSRGFDFGGYKRSTLMRRVAKRMSSLGLSDFSDYVDFLEVHPDEFSHLFNTMLINVTSFFRDQEAWDYLRTDVIPQIIADNAPDGVIRVWSAGCASGEEAYSIAILLCEMLGASEFQQRVKIYATDIDEEALLQARQSMFTQRDLEGVRPALVEKYFLPSNGRFVFHSELRRSVIFGRHDLVQDAPISHLDLLLCRNTLMYLNAETQARIMARMHFALKPTGFLFLGKAEMLLSHAHLFKQVDLQHRVFSKIEKAHARDRLLIMTPPGEPDDSVLLNNFSSLRDLALETTVLGQIVVNRQGEVCLVSERARAMFGISPNAIGQPFQDLEISYRPLELRSLIDQSYREQRAIRVPRVGRQLSASVQLLDVLISPLVSNGSGPMGVAVSFEDVTEFHRLYDDLQSMHEELETTNEELQSTNEELETTNEELQSTNEELETTNEELQSTNEELETTNEELQSTNEELETTNEDLRNLTDEVRHTNNFLDAILSSMRTAVIVIDLDLKVRVWNNKAEDFWGVRPSEAIGTKLTQLDIGLPTAPIANLVEKPLRQNDLREITLESINRRGKRFTCVVRVTVLTADPGERGWVIFVEETTDY